jgi:thiol-disulfide isomerase/thioredoxin
MPAADIERILSNENIADDEPALRIGSPAPALHADGWLSGDPVAPTAGAITVVENWATWCKPCIEAMPHLSELADRYADRGVTVVAINVEDTELDDVRQFVADHAADMRYSVGYDRSGAIEEHWIEAAGLRGLPASFVIDRGGRIAWVGHPKALDRAVDDLANDRWDIDAARSKATRERLAVPYSQRVVELLETDAPRGYQLVRALLASVLRDQPEYLAGLAYHILAAPVIAERDLDIAYTAGALACARTDWSDPATLETLSKIREAQGRRDDAIALQRRAVDVGASAQRYARRLNRLVSGS